MSMRHALSRRHALVTLIAFVVAAVGASVVGASVLSPASRYKSATITVHIYPAQHGREVVDVPNFAIEPGVHVTVRFVNHTRLWHTFTVPGLRVGAMIAPQDAAPRVTHVRFTAWRFGVFDWRCVLCESAAHPGVHQMRGKVYAIIGERWPAP